MGRNRVESSTESGAVKIGALYLDLPFDLFGTDIVN